jgi:hypothetical protein
MTPISPIIDSMSGPYQIHQAISPSWVTYSISLGSIASGNWWLGSSDPVAKYRTVSYPTVLLSSTPFDLVHLPSLFHKSHINHELHSSLLECMCTVWLAQVLIPFFLVDTQKSTHAWYHSNTVLGNVYISSRLISPSEELCTGIWQKTYTDCFSDKCLVNHVWTYPQFGNKKHHVVFKNGTGSCLRLCWYS